MTPLHMPNLVRVSLRAQPLLLATTTRIDEDLQIQLVYEIFHRLILSIHRIIQV